VLKPLDKELIEQRFCLDRVHYVGGLIYAELFGDDRELRLQNLPNAMLDRVLQDEVDRAQHVRLPDTVDAADALFDPHRVPGHVEVHDDVAELEVQTLASSVRRDQNTDISGE